MAVPDYQSLMLSLLKVAADGNEHTLSETIGNPGPTASPRRPGPN